MDNGTKFSKACKQCGQWGVLLVVSNDAGNDPSEVAKAAPCLTEDQVLALMLAPEPLFLFYGSENEARAAYGLVVGDDGPTGSNSYNGVARVYAELCNPQGRILTENT